MQHRFQHANLSPDGFAVDEVKLTAEKVQIQLRSRQPSRVCPCYGRRVELTIMVCRFWCDAVLCDQYIFCEQFGEGVLARYGRCTQQLETNEAIRELSNKGTSIRQDSPANCS